MHDARQLSKALTDLALCALGNPETPELYLHLSGKVLVTHSGAIAVVLLIDHLHIELLYGYSKHTKTN